MGKQWTKEEEDYLWEVINNKTQTDGRPFTVAVVWMVFNDHFKRIKGKDYQDRSLNAIKGKRQELYKRYQILGEDWSLDRKAKKLVEQVIQPKKVKKVETKRRIIIGQNSRMKWSPKDDMYLVRNWSADSKEREAVAKHLQRSVKGCQTRLNRISKTKPEYLNTLIAGKKMPKMRSPQFAGNPVEQECECCNGCKNRSLWFRFTEWRSTRKALRIKRKAEKLQRQLEALK